MPVASTARRSISEETGPDISRADFVWCMTAITWGWSTDETAERLMEESAKAQENGAAMPSSPPATPPSPWSAAAARRGGKNRRNMGDGDGRRDHSHWATMG